MSIWAHDLRADSQAPAWPALIAIAAVVLAASATGCAGQPNLADGTHPRSASAVAAPGAQADDGHQVGGDAEVAGSAETGPGESAARTPMPPLRNEDTRKAFWRMLASLAVVLVLVVVAAVVGKKFLPRLAAQGRRQLRVMETLHVAPRNAVHLMRVGDRVFMLGSTKEGLTTLGDVTEAVAAAPDPAEGEGDA